MTTIHTGPGPARVHIQRRKGVVERVEVPVETTDVRALAASFMAGGGLVFVLSLIF